MRLLIGDRLQRPKNLIVITARGYFGDADADYAFDLGLPANDDNWDVAAKAFATLNYVKNSSPDDRRVLDQWVEDNNAQVPEDQALDLTDDYDQVARVEKLQAIFYNADGHAHKLNLKLH